MRIRRMPRGRLRGGRDEVRPWQAAGVAESGSGTDGFLLAGGRAALGVLDAGHAPLLSLWMNDPEVRRGLPSAAWRTRRRRSAGSSTEDGEPVGVCSLEEIDHAFGRCEFGI
jgi:hypothetical protein